MNLLIVNGYDRLGWNKLAKHKIQPICEFYRDQLKKINPKRYPMIKLIKLLPEKQSLFETVIVSANDKLVELFLEKKISFLDIQRKLFKIIKKKEFLKLKKKSHKNHREISDLNKYVRLKITQNSI